MPQLEVSTFVPQLVWLAITFVVLYLLMAGIGLPRVGGAIEARRRRVDDDLARAAQLKSEAEAVLAAYPGDVVERVVQLSNGKYEVHYIGVNWPHHIFVNQVFQVVGGN